MHCGFNGNNREKIKLSVKWFNHIDDQTSEKEKLSMVNSHLCWIFLFSLVVSSTEKNKVLCISDTITFLDTYSRYKLISATSHSALMSWLLWLSFRCKRQCLKKEKDQKTLWLLLRNCVNKFYWNAVTCYRAEGGDSSRVTTVGQYVWKTLRYCAVS